MRLRRFGAVEFYALGQELFSFGGVKHKRFCLGGEDRIQLRDEAFGCRCASGIYDRDCARARIRRGRLEGGRRCQALGQCARQSSPNGRVFCRKLIELFAPKS